VAQITEKNFLPNTARFKARIPPHLRMEFSPFIVRELA
jgi:hypothetical protein